MLNDARKGCCGTKELEANGDFVLSAYIRLLHDIPFWSPRPRMSSKDVPSQVGIITAGQVCRTTHPGFTENCT